VNKWSTMQIPKNFYHRKLAAMYYLRSQIIIKDAEHPTLWPRPRNSLPRNNQWGRDVTFSLRCLNGFDDTKLDDASKGHQRSVLNLDPIARALVEDIRLQISQVHEQWALQASEAGRQHECDKCRTLVENHCTARQMQNIPQAGHVWRWVTPRGCSGG